MNQLDALTAKMNSGTVAREVISDPITLESTVNGARITVQRNSIAHAELAQGENGMLVKGINSRSKAFNVGVGFNKDGTIKGREHLIKRTPGADVRNVSPAQAAVRARESAQELVENAVVETSQALADAEAQIAEANDKASKAQLEAAETKQQLAALEESQANLRKQLAEARSSQSDSVKKR
jgi:hypothetical protein